MTDFAYPHFAEPEWLWLGAATLPALLILQLRAARLRRRQLNALVSPGLVSRLTRSHRPAKRAFKDVLLLLAIIGMSVALARPQWGARELAAQELGEDTVFILDCSRSMLAADAPPNRLQRAKLAILEFVRHYQGGRVGLVAFAGDAFLQCPLTFDYDAFEDALRAIDDKTIPVQGTDIGRALDEAFQAMEKTDRKKAMVLVTDGEDLEKTGVRAAESLAGKGIVIFAVGVGTQAGSEIRIANEQGRPDLVRDNQEEPVRSRLDEATLRAIAEATKGKYFRLGAMGEGLAKVRLALMGGDASRRTILQQKLGVDRFHIPIAIILGLLAVESLIGTRGKGVA